MQLNPSSAAAVGVYVLRSQFKEAKNILDQQQELIPEIKNDKRFIGVKQYYENALKKSGSETIDSSENSKTMN